MNRTPLYEEHLRLGAKMTPFHGWDMPLYYSSILEEHQVVRSAVGLFDVSHMGQVFVRGPGALAMLNELVVSDIANVGEGRACYTMLVNEHAGILDDIIVFRFGADEFLVVVNCATREKDVAWMLAHRPAGVELRDRSAERSILAIQGPLAASLLDGVLATRVSVLGRFDLMPLRAIGQQTWVARTGYTGSDGFEVFLPNVLAVGLWRRLFEQGRQQGIQPIGLGARDTLRLEAGLRLYGTDMDETTTPYEADLGWTVALTKPVFLGREILAQQKAVGVKKRLVGVALEQGPVPRHGHPILVSGRQVGTVTSGTFSPLLNQPIGLGYVEYEAAAPGTPVALVIRSRSYPGTVVKLPFWRGKSASPSEKTTEVSA